MLTQQKVLTEQTVRTDANPTPRKTETLDVLLREIGDDARSLAESYPQQTRVPEGGE